MFQALKSYKTDVRPSLVKI